METHHLLRHFTSFTAIISTPPPSKTPKLPFYSLCTICCSSTKSGPHVNKPKWDSTSTGRSRFNPYQDFFTDNEGDDEEEEFGFGASKKQRVWWSDDAEYEYEDNEEEFWGFKILRAFGWMLPAVMISAFLGTGMNTLFMAIALPLGQTALSLAIDKVWGRTEKNYKPRPKRRTKKRPYARAASNNRTKIEEDDYEVNNNERSCPSVGGFSAGSGGKSTSSFGGWDELDREKETKRSPNWGPNRKVREPSGRQKNGKLSRRIRNRETPLLMRLLIAVFPFLGTWTRFL